MSYTAAELVTLACQICNIPGRTAQVGKLLNIILADYAQTMDLDTIRKTATINIGPQAITPYFYPLPSDYLRAYDVFYNINGTVFFLPQQPLNDLDREYTADGISNYPEWYTTDVAQNIQPTAGSSPSIAFYPPPAIVLAVTVRYRPQTSDLATPESNATVPWFPNQRVLLKDLCVDAAMLADDARGPGWEKEVENRMRKYLIMDDDKEGYSQTVKLDPRSFRTRVNLPPSKKLGF